ncbi:MAG: ATP-binding protein [Bacteroidota bacterium]
MLSKAVDILVVLSDSLAALSSALERAHYMKIPVIVMGHAARSHPHVSAVIRFDYENLAEELNEFLKHHTPHQACRLRLPQHLMRLLKPLQTTFQLKIAPLEGQKALSLSTKGPGFSAHDPHMRTFLIVHPGAAYSNEVSVNELPLVEIHEERNAGSVLEQLEQGKMDRVFLFPSPTPQVSSLLSMFHQGQAFPQEHSLKAMVVRPEHVSWVKNQMKYYGDLQQKIRHEKSLTLVKERIFKNFRLIIYLFLVALIILIVLGTLVFIYFKGEQQINDILEAKNQEILEQKNQVQLMAEKAEQATQEKFRFFTNISHEFRTPLTLILAPVNDWIRKTQGHNPRLKKDLELIRINSLRLLRLVSQLMDFRKIEHGKMVYTPSKIDIITFLHEVSESFEQLAKQKKIDIEFKTEISQLFLFFDPDKLDKVLFNLLSNAFKFTREKGRISIELSLNETADTCIILISDNGMGMTEEQQNHIFDRFYQGRESANLGSGLGLSLSKELIELHQGKLSVESKKWQGTTFSIFLPTGAQHLPKKPQTENRNELLDAYKSINPLWISELGYTYTEKVVPEQKTAAQTLLIIEDHPDLAAYLVDILGRTYHVVSANNGEIGLEMAQRHIPDLILCDIDLPGMNGYEILDHLKSDKRTSHIPIIIITVLDEQENKIKGLEGGADDYISKPFNVNMLSLKIKNLLNARRVLKERYINELDITIADGTRNSLDKQFVNEFISLVNHEAFDPEFGVEFICKELGMSRIQLYRKTKALIGYGVKEYINNVRLKKSKYLLKQTGLSMTEIADEIGFSSAAYFGRVFKTKYNLSPTEYRNSHTYPLEP